MMNEMYSRFRERGQEIIEGQQDDVRESIEILLSRLFEVMAKVDDAKLKEKRADANYQSMLTKCQEVILERHQKEIDQYLLSSFLEEQYKSMKEKSVQYEKKLETLKNKIETSSIDIDLLKKEICQKEEEINRISRERQQSGYQQSSSSLIRSSPGSIEISLPDYFLQNVSTNNSIRSVRN